MSNGSGTPHDSATPWRSVGVCSPPETFTVEQRREHLARWFPPNYYNAGHLTREADAAIRACLQCPSLRPCREYAITTRQDAGIWGGMTPHMREQLYGRIPARKAS
jgi:hypothetical protein